MCQGPNFSFLVMPLILKQSMNGLEVFLPECVYGHVRIILMATNCGLLMEETLHWVLPKVAFESTQRKTANFKLGAIEHLSMASKCWMCVEFFQNIYCMHKMFFLIPCITKKSKISLPHMLVILLKPHLVHLKQRWLKYHKDGNQMK